MATGDPSLPETRIATTTSPTTYTIMSAKEKEDREYAWTAGIPASPQRGCEEVRGWMDARDVWMRHVNKTQADKQPSVPRRLRSPYVLPRFEEAFVWH